jgi:uncharacterized membrane protein YraQ (UPF0718 family)
MRSAKELALGSMEEMKKIFPVFFVVTLISVIFETYVPMEITRAILGKNPLLSIPLATIIGIILPIPRYATYPIAFSLLQQGASMGAIFSLIAGEVIIGSPDRDMMEFKYFGWKAFTLRLVLCMVFVMLGGFLVEVFF